MLTAGPELDAKIAEACGYKAVITQSGCCIPDPGGLRMLVRWRPSTDLNATFRAAEKCGLFDGDSWHLRKNIDETWSIRSTVEYSCECTPALAICAAIIAITEA